MSSTLHCKDGIERKTTEDTGDTEEVEIPTLSHKTREGWGTRFICWQYFLSIYREKAWRESVTR
jgi:hypothetical protein